MIGFVAIAIWLFMGGQHSRLPHDSTPRWLLENPSWILGAAALGLAFLAAVLPSETIETAILHIILARAGFKMRGEVRGLGHHDVTELGLSSDTNAEENVNGTEFETLRALSNRDPEE